MLNNKETIKKVIILLIFAIAIIIRIIKWPLIMEEINCDEAMTAINAKAISETGCDMYGTSFPVYFEAWLVGGQSALLTYLMSTSIKIFGFSIMSIRLPLLIISIISIFIFDKLVKIIFEDNYEIRVIMLLILALNPWHIMQSSWALDCNLFPHFMLYAIYFLIKGVKQNKKYLYISIVLFGITLYTYGIALYATPVFLVISYLYLLKNKKIKISDAIISVLIFIIISCPVILMSVINLLGLPTVKIGNITIQKFEYFKRTEDMLLFSQDFPKTLIKNILTTIKLILINEDGLSWNAIHGVGTIYIGSIIFAIVALIQIIVSKKQKNDSGISIITIWFITSIIIGMLINNVNINRLNIIWYPIIFLVGYGIYIILKKCKFNKLLLCTIVTIYFIYFAFFIEKFYSTDYNRCYTWSNGLIDTVRQAEKISNKEEIYIQDSIINNDRNRVFLIYETIKDYQKYNFINREILLELYQREEKEVFSEWLTKITNIRIINMNQIEENMKCIILYKKETDNLLKNYNAKEYEIYKIMHKKGE